MEADPSYGFEGEVRFTDGEVLQGSTIGYDPQQPGFFLILRSQRQQREDLRGILSGEAIPFPVRIQDPMDRTYTLVHSIAAKKRE